jgi:hypothetical protein
MLLPPVPLPLVMAPFVPVCCGLFHSALLDSGGVLVPAEAREALSPVIEPALSLSPVIEPARSLSPVMERESGAMAGEVPPVLVGVSRGGAGGRVSLGLGFGPP